MTGTSGLPPQRHQNYLRVAPRIPNYLKAAPTKPTGTSGLLHGDPEAQNHLRVVPTGTSGGSINCLWAAKSPSGPQIICKLPKITSGFPHESLGAQNYFRASPHNPKLPQRCPRIPSGPRLPQGRPRSSRGEPPPSLPRRARRYLSVTAPAPGPPPGCPRGHSPAGSRRVGRPSSRRPGRPLTAQARGHAHLRMRDSTPLWPRLRTQGATPLTHAGPRPSGSAPDRGRACAGVPLEGPMESGRPGRGRRGPTGTEKDRQTSTKPSRARQNLTGPSRAQKGPREPDMARKSPTEPS